MRKRSLTIEKFSGDKVPREAPPPSKWGQSKTGAARFVVCKVGFRNKHGKKLYRLGYFVGNEHPPLFSQHMWTLDELNSSGVEWLSESPFAPGAPEQLPDDTPVPEDAVVDDGPEEEPKPEPIPLKPSTGLGPGNHKLPDLPTTFEGRYGFKVGDVAYHVSSGKPYRILGTVDMDTARVEEVAEDGVKRPARNMSGAKLQRGNREEEIH